jgi:hypothetical protein
MILTPQEKAKELVRVSFSCNNECFDFENVLKKNKGYSFLNHKIIENNINSNYPKFTHIVDYLRDKKI